MQQLLALQLDSLGEPTTVAEMLTAVHASRGVHHGVCTTWKRLQRSYPGNRVPLKRVYDFVMECAVCQKERHGMSDALVPLHRPAVPEYAYPRKRIGVDTLEITPRDEAGNQCVVVVCMLVQKTVALYPCAEHTALNTARALLQCFATYGRFDELASDPGTEFTAEVTDHLLRWLGVDHRLSLVARHEGNGVEGTNRSILRHVRTLCMDRFCKDRWSDPEVLSLVQYVLNSQRSIETGRSHSK